MGLSLTFWLFLFFLGLLFWRSDTFIERDGIEIKENKHSNWDKYILAPLQYWVESPSPLNLLSVDRKVTDFEKPL